MEVEVGQEDLPLGQTQQAPQLYRRGLEQRVEGVHGPFVVRRCPDTFAAAEPTLVRAGGASGGPRPRGQRRWWVGASTLFGESVQ